MGTGLQAPFLPLD